MKTGQQLIILRGHACDVMALAFDDKGQKLLSLDWNRTLKVWDSRAAPLAHTIRTEDTWINSVAFSPDGRQLASCGINGVLTLRETFSTRVLWSQPVGNDPEKNVVHPAWCVTFSRDGQFLAVGLGDWKKADREVPVKVLSAATGKELKNTLKGHLGLAWGVAFGPGRLVASAGGELNRPGMLLLHDLDGGPPLRRLEVAEGGLRDVVFSPDGRWVAATASNVYFVRIWDVATGKELHTLQTDEGCSGLAVSPDGSSLAAGDGINIRVWDTQGMERAVLHGHTGFVLKVVFSPDGRRLASTSEDRTLKIWDWPSGQEIIILRGHTDIVSALAFSPDGKRIASAGQDGTIKIWDAERGAEPDVRRVRH